MCQLGRAYLNFGAILTHLILNSLWNFIFLVLFDNDGILKGATGVVTLYFYFLFDYWNVTLIIILIVDMAGKTRKRKKNNFTLQDEPIVQPPSRNSYRDEPIVQPSSKVLYNVFITCYLYHMTIIFSLHYY